MLAPIVAIKHYVQEDNTQIASGAIRPMELIQGVAQTGVVNVQDVVEGALVKAIFIEYWVKSFAGAGTDVKFQVCLEKVPAGATSVTFAQMNTMMAYPNKKNVFFFGQGVLGDNSTQAVPVIRQWFKLPKGKQRFGLDDVLMLTLSATSAALQNCGFATYKEYK